VQLTEDTSPGTIFYRLKATDPDVPSHELGVALNFAAAEPITAVDKTGQPVTNADDFKVTATADEHARKQLSFQLL